MGMFSIIIPLYNKGATIESTIRSVLDQLAEDDELIVVDDGSTDGSAEIARSISDTRLRIIGQENAGQSKAKNHGVQCAHNDWVIFLDADDCLLPDALAVFRKMISENPGCDCYCGNIIVKRNGKAVWTSEKARFGRLKNNFYSYYFKHCVPHTGSAAYRRSILGERPFNENHRRAEDVEMVFNVFRSHPVFSFTQPVMEYNKDYCQVSRSNRDWEHDFQFHIDLAHKSFWEKMCLYELYIDAKDRYRITGKAMYKDYDRRYILLLAEKLFRKRW